jgi:hypothetical protein
MKRAGCQCGPLKDCGVPGSPADMCETDGQGNCFEWIVGDLGLYEKRPEEIESSTTRFLLTKDFIVDEPGLLAAAGVRKGDRLVSVHKYPIANPRNIKAITGWKFKNKTLKIGYARHGVVFVGTMENPKGKN